MVNTRLSAAGALLFLVTASHLYATSVPLSAIPIYSTGDGPAVDDPHYDLVSAPDGVALGPATEVDSDGGAVTWAATGPDWGWDALESDYRQGHPISYLRDPAGWYDFQITFDLTGFVASTVTISGSWAADNYGYIELNGVDTGVALTSDESFRTLTAFAITTGFQPGLNTLDFMVYNLPANTSPGAGGDPVGLAVDMTGDGVLVPEPASLGFCGLALVAGCACLRKRRS